jgi:hypothetical protein
MASESLLAILSEVVCAIYKDLIIQRLGREVFLCTTSGLISKDLLLTQTYWKGEE